MSLPGYRYALWQPAFEFWQMQPEKSRDRLPLHFEWLAAHPHHEGFASDYDSVGRRVLLSICGDYIVTHGSDHSVRLLQIEDVVSG